MGKLTNSQIFDVAKTISHSIGGTYLRLALRDFLSSSRRTHVACPTRKACSSFSMTCFPEGLHNNRDKPQFLSWYQEMILNTKDMNTEAKRCRAATETLLKQGIIHWHTRTACCMVICFHREGRMKKAIYEWELILGWQLRPKCMWRINVCTELISFVRVSLCFYTWWLWNSDGLVATCLYIAKQTHRPTKLLSVFACQTST